MLISRISVVLLILSATLPVSASNQVKAHYVDIGGSGTSTLLASDGAGNLFVVGTMVEPWGRPQIRVIKTDSEGKTLATFDFGGSSSDVPQAAVVDPKGNLIIAGIVVSSDFPIVNGLNLTTPDDAGFLVKLSPQLDRILFSTRLGGSTHNTAATALTVDPAGNIVVAGTTPSRDFPITSNAFQTQPPNMNNPAPSYYAFVTKINSSGNQILFSTFFGADTAADFNDAGTQNHARTGAASVTFDSSGNIVLAGSTQAVNLPVTSGAYLTQCSCKPSAGFVAKFSPDLSKLLWSTYFPAPIATAAPASDGAVVIAGAAGIDLPTTSPSVQNDFPSGSPASPPAGYVAKLDVNGSRLVFSTFLGGYFSAPSENAPAVIGVTSVAIDPSGDIRATGASLPSALPLPSGAALLGPTFSIALSSDGTAIHDYITAPLGAAGRAVVVTAQGSIATLGPAGSILIETAAQAPSVVGIMNSAGYTVSSAVAPFELISIYGIGLGPATPVNGQLNSGPVNIGYMTSLAGVQVMFDGIPAPLLYVGPNQINAVVPQSVDRAAVTEVTVVTPNGTINGPAMFVHAAQPQVFRDPAAGLTGSAIAINADGTLNSVSNPAAAGSAVTIWTTGMAINSSPFGDGNLVTSEGPAPSTPVAIVSNTQSVEIDSVAPELGAVLGVMVVKFRPTGTGYYRLQSGDALSEAFFVYRN